MNTAKPFLKWAGGKSQLLVEIKKHYPNNFNKYCEPFVGGGAVLFDVLNNFSPKEVLINDINSELINCYDKIKNNVRELIDILSDWQLQYQNSDTEQRKEIFSVRRQRFNDLIREQDNSVEKAALMIYLNKTCFNGLYRVNSQGAFNVPCGNYKNPGICQRDNLNAVSKALQNVTITIGDYSHTADFIDSDTFVYIDPPYRPLSQSSSFTSYSKEGFSDKKQIELSNFVKKIRQKYGLTQKEYALVIGVGEVTVHRFENGAIQTEAIDSIMKLSNDPDNMAFLLLQNRNNIDESLYSLLLQRVSELQTLKRHALVDIDKFDGDALDFKEEDVIDVAKNI